MFIPVYLFESALLDAHLQLSMDEASNILVGGVDELADHTTKIHKLINHVKPAAVSSMNLLESDTDGAVFSEGANFFVLSKDVKVGAYAELLSVETLNSLAIDGLNKVVCDLLEDYGLKVEDIDLLIQGNNGDRVYDSYYHHLSSGLFKNTPQVYYKHLCGEFNTASSFGFWLAAKILKLQNVPDVVRFNHQKESKLETILLYNQYRGKNHSFVLLRKC